jgi:hypothetical protein
MSDHIPDVTKMINDGGPAFPRTGADGHTSPQSGMTIRDYFAAAALQGFLAYDGGGKSCLQDAELAYQAADAMIRAREAK